MDESAIKKLNIMSISTPVVLTPFFQNFPAHTQEKHFCRSIASKKAMCAAAYWYSRQAALAGLAERAA